MRGFVRGAEAHGGVVKARQAVSRVLWSGAVAGLVFLRAGALCAQGVPVPAPYVPWIEEQAGKTAPQQAPRPETKKSYPRKAVITPRRDNPLREGEEKDAAPAAMEEAQAPSALEQAYSARIVEQLSQFGYDLFAGAGRDDGARTGIPSGAVQDDFILGTGDRLSILFRGQRSGSGVYEIDNQGLLVAGDFAPVSAAGRSLGAVRAELEAQALRLHNTDIFVSLDKVRQIDVLVAGEVRRPGRKTLTVFDTVLDALDGAGGIGKTGSLRQIKLVRHGRSTVIDLYGLLIHGSGAVDLSLEDGDKLIVPPVGPTVAVAGGVKRPGIYEIEPLLKGMMHDPDKRARSISLEEALDMAGGVLSPGQNRFLRLGLTTDGRETVEESGGKAYDPVFGDGSILMVAPSREARAGTVELAGETRRPGIFDLDGVPTLSALLGDEKVFGPDIYPLIGVIERWNGGQMARQMIDFPPLLVLRGQYDRRLQDGDAVHLFSRGDIVALQRQMKTGQAPEIESGDAAADEAGISDPALASFLAERSAYIRGAVRQEGAWPVAEGVALDNLVIAAGGMTLDASARNVEVTARDGGGAQRVSVDYVAGDPASVMLHPGDTIRVNRKFAAVAGTSVSIAGEVASPGRYDLAPGDTLSDLLQRAGGLTQQAYPDGTVFSRESERKAEESRFRSAARDLERALAAAMKDEDKAPDAGQVAMARDLAAELRQVEAVGRITVEADPGVLAAEPDLDILLEPGDRIYIPKRPLSVRVSGEVLSPATLQFRKDREATDYIAQAGGFTYEADKDRTFVVYPDGSAQPLAVSAWNHSPAFIPPGSSIVVPRDPKPFDFMQSARDISQILSNLAVTGIFLDDLRDN